MYSHVHSGCSKIFSCPGTKILGLAGAGLRLERGLVTGLRMLGERASAGIGLRHPHYARISQEKPSIPWLEIHSENFFMAGGPSLLFLERIAQDYPLSFHGVSLSLGSADGLDAEHLDRLKQLVDRFNPFLISDHLSWGRIGDQYLHDLLPIPYTDECLEIMAANIDKTQSYLKREILIENPSSYLEFKSSHHEEVDFLVALGHKTGCGLLLDVNNIYVSCWNHGWDPQAYLEKIPDGLVQEIHLAGHSVRQIGDHSLLIDTHDSAVPPEVWGLYRQAVDHLGPLPTLIEWDKSIPELDVLLAEAHKAQLILNDYRGYHDIAC